MTLTIDPEFQALCPPLLPEEREQLEASLVAEGCRDPLCVWTESWKEMYCKYCSTDRSVTASDGIWVCDACDHGLAPFGTYILDGHNRYELCTQHNIPLDWQEIDLDTREEAINWIIANQLGRRNLTEEQKSYLRGKRYNLNKPSAGHPTEENLPFSSRALAKTYGVTHATIQADGQFAQAIDTLEAQVRQDIRETVLRRQDRDPGKITKQQVTTTGKLVQEQKVAPQPFMRREGWKPYQVLEAIEVLGKFPPEEHPALNTLLDQPFIPAEDGLAILKYLDTMAQAGRQHIYTLQASGDLRDRSDALTLAANKHPEPDRQGELARQLVHTLEEALNIRRRWKKHFPTEPWSTELEEIDRQLGLMKEQVRTIAVAVKTQRAERIAYHAITITAG
jgi:hypothetical protein